MDGGQDARWMQKKGRHIKQEVPGPRAWVCRASTGRMIIQTVGITRWGGIYMYSSPMTSLCFAGDQVHRGWRCFKSKDVCVSPGGMGSSVRVNARSI